MIRYAALATLLSGVALTGCANDPLTPGAAGLGTNALSMVSPAEANQSTQTRQLSAGFDIEDPATLGVRKTLAGKVLTAIALERVTGRKPDPARISEIY